MDINFISHFLHLEAEKQRLFSVEFADDLHVLARQVTVLPDLLPQTILCGECDGPMVIHEYLCPKGSDYKYGYRVIRRCLVCGEMEIR